MNKFLVSVSGKRLEHLNNLSWNFNASNLSFQVKLLVRLNLLSNCW